VILDGEVGPVSFCGRLCMFGPPHEYLPWTDLELPGQAAPLAPWAGLEDWNHRHKIRRLIALPIGMGLPVLGHPNLILSMLVLDLVEGLEETYRRAGRVEVIAQLSWTQPNGRRRA